MKVASYIKLAVKEHARAIICSSIIKLGQGTDCISLSHPIIIMHSTVHVIVCITQAQVLKTGGTIGYRY